MTAPAAARPLASLEQRVEIETPEQVAFTYTVAGVGSRAAAAIVDYLYCAGILLLLWFLGQLGSAAFASGKGAFDDLAPRWMFAVFTFAQFAILWCWYVLWEGLADGQTPGKRHLGLRVVQDGGFPVTFGTSAVRNIVRAIDMQPGIVYAVGIVSVAVSKSGKRLGDLAAGTIVVQERAVDLLPAAPAASPRAAAAPHATLLTEDEYLLLERFVARRGDLDAERRARLVADLAGRFRARAPELTGSDAAVLLQLHERERAARASGVAARSDTGAQREQHALVAQGSDRWRRFAARLEDTRRRGLPQLGEAEVSGFVAEYREIAADLARLRTAARGRDVDAVYYLSRLVAGAHNLFYRRKVIPARAALDFLAVDVPREIRRSARPILLAAALLFAPMLGTWTAVVRDPSLTTVLVPAGFIDRAETARARVRRGEAYLPERERGYQGSVLTSLIMTNNIKVAFAAFAGGMSAGVMTVLALVFNGISLGAGLGVFQNEEALPIILGFVAPHGAFELTAICIAGGAGLLLAAAILLPGARTRRDALVANGVRAIRLVAASTLLLVFAGIIEGNVSPRPWPWERKLVVFLVTSVVMALWFAWGSVGAWGGRAGADAGVVER